MHVSTGASVRLRSAPWRYLALRDVSFKPADVDVDGVTLMRSNAICCLSN